MNLEKDSAQLYDTLIENLKIQNPSKCHFISFYVNLLAFMMSFSQGKTIQLALRVRLQESFRSFSYGQLDYPQLWAILQKDDFILDDLMKEVHVIANVERALYKQLLGILTLGFQTPSQSSMQFIAEFIERWHQNSDLPISELLRQRQLALRCFDKVSPVVADSREPFVIEADLEPNPVNLPDQITVQSKKVRFHVNSFDPKRCSQDQGYLQLEIPMNPSLTPVLPQQLLDSIGEKRVLQIFDCLNLAVSILKETRLKSSVTEYALMISSVLPTDIELTLTCKKIDNCLVCEDFLQLFYSITWANDDDEKIHVANLYFSLTDEKVVLINHRIPFSEIENMDSSEFTLIPSQQVHKLSCALPFMQANLTELKRSYVNERRSFWGLLFPNGISVGGYQSRARRILDENSARRVRSLLWQERSHHSASYKVLTHYGVIP